jgi:hypothetical protein
LGSLIAGTKEKRARIEIRGASSSTMGIRTGEKRKKRRIKTGQQVMELLAILP